MKRTRRAWYLLVSMIAVVSAEALSGSTAIIFPIDPLVLLLYAVHYILILDFLTARRALSLRTLAVGGIVLGFTTESLLTKVIWNPPWDDGELIRIAGLGVYEVGFIVLIWHAWMSLALPVALTYDAFGFTRILTPRWRRRVLVSLPLALTFIAALGNMGPEMAVPVVALNGAGILLAAWWFQRAQRRAPVQSLNDLRLTRGERRVTWLLTLLLYAIITPTRAEAFPSAGPLALGLGLVVGSIWLLVAVRRADANTAPTPGAAFYTARGFVRYLLYFGAVSVVTMTLAILAQPVSTGAAVVLVLALIPPTVFGVLRLAWRTRRAPAPIPLPQNIAPPSAA